MNIKRQILGTMMASMGINLEQMIEDNLPKQNPKSEQPEESKNYFLQKTEEKRMRKTKKKEESQ